jgi:hypothetical protein
MYGDKPLKVGDRVFARTSGNYGVRDARNLHTIVRTSHKGQRLYTDTGLVILARDNSLMGSGEYSRTWYARYTPEQGEEWARQDRRSAALTRIREAGGEELVRKAPFRYDGFPIDQLEKIAQVLEDAITVYTQEVAK